MELSQPSTILSNGECFVTIPVTFQFHYILRTYANNTLFHLSTRSGGLEDNNVGNLTIALVNLTRVSGKEGQVVEATIHQAFTNILAPHPDLGPACARGLYNLTCVDSTYPLIEKVSRALIQLSSTTSVQNVKHICAAALCNLADLKAARMRLVEEGRRLYTRPPNTPSSLVPQLNSLSFIAYTHPLIHSLNTLSHTPPTPLHPPLLGVIGVLGALSKGS